MDSQNPSIPVKVRDAVYIGGLIAGALIGATAGVVAIWFPDISDQVNATAIVLSSGITVIVGGLGTAYRPGARDGS
jgi:hypothetical protein